MTVKELIEELQEIEAKYLDHEIILYHNGSADKWQIAEVGKENEWEDEEEIYITISQKGKQMSCLQNEILLEKWYEEALAETLKEYKDVAKAEEEAEKIARDRLERESE